MPFPKRLRFLQPMFRPTFVFQKKGFLERFSEFEKSVFKKQQRIEKDYEDNGNKELTNWERRWCQERSPSVVRSRSRGSLSFLFVS